ncbi:MAG: hypothetical protein D6797_03100 [Bdellovibrio sp.]|nr:MAG: hypothetical protein D6797_03100 [Bdellovibrio sp.]
MPEDLNYVQKPPKQKGGKAMVEESKIKKLQEAVAAARSKGRSIRFGKEVEDLGKELLSAGLSAVELSRKTSIGYHTARRWAKELSTSSLPIVRFKKEPEFSLRLPNGVVIEPVTLKSLPEVLHVVS